MKETKCNYKKILAMDLSLNLPAFAVIEVENGVIKIIKTDHVDNKKNSKLSHGEKLQLIRDKIREISKEHYDVTDVVREKGFSRFALTTQTLFKVVGVSDLAIVDELGKTVITEIPPTSVKTLVAGYGKADKLEVEEGVRTFLSEDQKEWAFYSDDESDAVAVGIAYAIKKGWLN